MSGEVYEVKRVCTIQENGQVTLPVEWCEKYGLKDGDIVSFVETDQGLLVVPHVVLTVKLLDEIGEELKRRGVTLEQLLEDSEQIRQEIYEERYGKKRRP